MLAEHLVASVLTPAFYQTRLLRAPMMPRLSAGFELRCQLYPLERGYSIAPPDNW